MRKRVLLLLTVLCMSWASYAQEKLSVHFYGYAFVCDRVSDNKEDETLFVTDVIKYCGSYSNYLDEEYELGHMLEAYIKSEYSKSFLCLDKYYTSIKVNLQDSKLKDYDKTNYEIKQRANKDRSAQITNVYTNKVIRVKKEDFDFGQDCD